MIRVRRPDRPTILRVATVVAAVLLVACVPLVVADRYLLRIFTLVGINLIVVAGLSLLFGYTGQVSLGHAAFVGLGAYGSAFLALAGWPWPIAMAGGIALASLGGLLLALPSLRLKGHYLAMATLGFGEIMFVFFDNAEGFTGGSDGLQGIPPASIGPLSVTSPEGNYWLAWAFACLALVLVANIVGRRPGRALRAIHGSEMGAQACGIDTVALKVKVFVVSAALAGLAGALGAHYIGSISPSSFTLHRSIILLTMVALGGSGSLSGAVGATVLLTLLPYADALIPGLGRGAAVFLQDWEPDIYGLVLIAVMLFMPRGLSGVAGAVARRARATVGSTRGAGEGSAP
ncbi:MAG TPA: branched-chain amino acid ABC transporter permease [Coriobacteriia bacterium]